MAKNRPSEDDYELINLQEENALLKLKVSELETAAALSTQVTHKEFDAEKVAFESIIAGFVNLFGEEVFSRIDWSRVSITQEATVKWWNKRKENQPL